MARTARELLDDVTRRLAPDPRANPLVPRIARGEADRATLAALGLEQGWVIPADRRAFLRLAERATGMPQAAGFFTLLAEGEELALERLAAYTAACGTDERQAVSWEPRSGCQAYPGFVAWLALNAAPADAALALTAGFSAWGGCCATIAGALRGRYGFPDEACAFFDLFAEPSPELDRRAEAAVREALDTGVLDERLATTYGRLLQSYEAGFWAALAQGT
jgi:hypothetical protein